MAAAEAEHASDQVHNVEASTPSPAGGATGESGSECAAAIPRASSDPTSGHGHLSRSVSRNVFEAVPTEDADGGGSCGGSSFSCGVVARGSDEGFDALRWQSGDTSGGGNGNNTRTKAAPRVTKGRLEELFGGRPGGDPEGDPDGDPGGDPDGGDAVSESPAAAAAASGAGRRADSPAPSRTSAGLLTMRAPDPAMDRALVKTPPRRSAGSAHHQHGDSHSFGGALGSSNHETRRGGAGPGGVAAAQASDRELSLALLPVVSALRGEAEAAARRASALGFASLDALLTSLEAQTRDARAALNDGDEDDDDEKGDGGGAGDDADANDSRGGSGGARSRAESRAESRAGSRASRTRSRSGGSGTGGSSSPHLKRPAAHHHHHPATAGGGGRSTSTTPRRDDRSGGGGSGGSSGSRGGASSHASHGGGGPAARGKAPARGARGARVRSSRERAAEEV